MKQCNTCRTHKLINEFQFMRYGYRRHICNQCYSDYLNKNFCYKPDRQAAIKQYKISEAW